MAQRRKKIDETDAPDRPLCGCGKSLATHQVTLTVRRLVLDREAGARTKSYWSASYP
ncbi:hypothetical protein LCGC14_1352400, partial [marine sediment metagenome]